MVKTKTVINTVHDYYRMIKPFFPIKRMILYGSYAKGTETENSDIDVGVVVDISDHSQRLKITTDLFHYARQVDSLLEPKCIFWDEYKNYDKTSILGEIIRTAKETQL